MIKLKTKSTRKMNKNPTREDKTGKKLIIKTKNK
jgi:hypothetical protein